MPVNHKHLIGSIARMSPIVIAASIVIAGCTNPAAQVGGNTPTPGGGSSGSTPSPETTAPDPEAGFEALPVELQPRPAPTTGSSPVFYSGPKKIGPAKALYLTYDDGPDGSTTIAVAKALRENKATATFFVLGSLVSTSSGTSTAKYLTDNGFPVGTHSWSHPVMGSWSASAVRSDLTRTSNAVKKATGLTPTCFRPPYGSFGKGITDVARQTDTRVAMWTIDPEDWKDPGASAVAGKVIAQLKPGAVVVMHDGAGHGKQAAAAIPLIVKAARDRGYELGSLCPMKP